VEAVLQNAGASDAVHGSAEVDAAGGVPEETEAEAVASAADATGAKDVAGVVDREPERVDSVSRRAQTVEQSPVILDVESAGELESQPKAETAETHETACNGKADYSELRSESTVSPASTSPEIDQTEAVPDTDPLAESLERSETAASSETTAVVEQTQSASEAEFVGQAEQKNVEFPEDLPGIDDAADSGPQCPGLPAATARGSDAEVDAEATQDREVESIASLDIGAVDELRAIHDAESPDETEAGTAASATVSTATEGVAGVVDREPEQVDSVSPEPPAVAETPLIPDVESTAALESLPVPGNSESHETSPNVKADAVAPDTKPESTAPSLLNAPVVDQPEADHDAGSIITSPDETEGAADSESAPTTEQPPVIEQPGGGDPALVDEPESEVTALSGVSTNAESDAVAKESEATPTRSPAPIPAAVDEATMTDAESVIEPPQNARADEPASDSPTHQRHAVPRRPPLSRRPAPTEAADEFGQTINDISTIDREYTRWNNAIVEYLLLAKPASEDIYLCVTPRVLATVFAEAGFDSLTPEQAEQRFSAAVASVYRMRVLGHSERLRVLRRCGEDGSPDCAAFLGASVLAAYHMQSDEDLSGNAYYRRFADLLQCEMSGNHPAGYNAPAFESLWVYLANWLREAHGRRLATRSPDVGLRRFVALPLAHVPLRSLDIDKLPVFFAWAGYEPGKRVRSDRLCSDLRRWHRSRNALTHTGAEALFDDRAEAVLSQVNAELESWDGSFSESVSRRSALIEIQFDVVQRQPMLAYLPRRPSGFPAVFDDGDHVFEASDEGWYAPARISPADGEFLASGFEWQSVIDGTQFALRRSETSVIALSPSANYSGFLSSRRLPRGIRSSVLCRDEVTADVVQYLSEAAQQRLNAVNHPLLPNGWSMIRDVTAKVYLEAPAGLENLEIDPNVEILVSGGLRLGRGWSWIAGAPPRILVAGVDLGDAVTVNGTPVEIGENGELVTNGTFAEPGQYVIEVGRTRRRIEAVAPEVSTTHRETKPSKCTSCFEPARIPLPRGYWTLVGASPGEVLTANGTTSTYGSMVVSCPFEAVWAIQVGAGPGAKALLVTEPQPPDECDVRTLKGPMRNAWQKWAGVIYSASIRRPQLCTLTGSRAAGIEQIWRQYVSVAKQIKHSVKRI